ncbi:unnamed protein product [Schistocephalus solidus]|uniref:Ig-like domain-containing protein n=1 Tax=Schistocephalus solidus TaxID=70667 RepID=A0A183T706_SCHSO|nr:unnamed protein product [Schistocephalus solidus]
MKSTKPETDIRVLVVVAADAVAPTDGFASTSPSITVLSSTLVQKFFWTPAVGYTVDKLTVKDDKAGDIVPLKVVTAQCLTVAAAEAAAGNRICPTPGKPPSRLRRCRDTHYRFLLVSHMSQSNDKPDPQNPVSQSPEPTVGLQFKQIVHRKSSPHQVGSSPRRCLLEWTPFEEGLPAASTFSLVNLSLLNRRVPQAQAFDEVEERVLTIRAPQSCLLTTDEAASGFYVTHETWMDPSQSEPSREAAEIGIGQRRVRLLTEQPTPSAVSVAEVVSSLPPVEPSPAVQGQQEEACRLPPVMKFSRTGSHHSLNKAKDVYFTVTTEDTLTATPGDYTWRKGPISTSECPVPTVSRVINLSNLSTCVYHGSVMDPHSVRLKRYFEAVDISSLPLYSAATEDSITEIQNQEVSTDPNTSSKTSKGPPKA